MTLPHGRRGEGRTSRARCRASDRHRHEPIGLSHGELSQLASRLRDSLAGVNLVVVMSHLACADETDRDMNWMQLARFRRRSRCCRPRPQALQLPPESNSGAISSSISCARALGFMAATPSRSRTNPYRTVAILTGACHPDTPARRRARRSAMAQISPRHGPAARDCRHRLCRRAGSRDGAEGARGDRRTICALCRACVHGSVGAGYHGYRGKRVARGAEVELMGDTVTLQEVADAAGTITHEVLASLSPRAHRVYVDG